jgi:hypothetical protein
VEQVIVILVRYYIALGYTDQQLLSLFKGYILKELVGCKAT